MDELGVPPESTTHPAVIAVGAAALILMVIALAGRNIVGVIAPGWEWWQARHERRFQRQVRIEAAARILNDARVEALGRQVEDLVAEIQAQREELIAQRDEERRRGDRLEVELAQMRRKLDRLVNEAHTTEGL